MRNAVGFVLELIGPKLMEIRHELGFYEFRMKRGHSIHGMTSHNCQVRHADLAVSSLQDQRHVAGPAIVSRPAL